MKTDALQQFPLGWMTAIALLLFLTAFAAIVWWTYRPDHKAFFERWANIPLDEKEDQQ